MRIAEFLEWGWFPIRHSKGAENACASQVISNVEHSSRKPRITRADIEMKGIVVVCEIWAVNRAMKATDAS
jgi:hypothetical protein